MNLQWWHHHADALGLWQAGEQLVGPCPSCGGHDRFRVCAYGVFCRQCCPNGGEEHRAAFRRILDAAAYPLGERDDDGEVDAPAPSNPLEAVRPLLACGQTPAIGEAAWRYLAVERRVWPQNAPLPTDTLTVARSNYAAPWNAKALSALAFLYRDLAGGVVGASLTALDHAGRRVPWNLPSQPKTLTVGTKRHAAFKVLGDTLRTPIVCEGEVTALACRWLHSNATTLAGGGVEGAWSLFAPERLLDADGDAAGRTLAARWREAGGSVHQQPDGMDAADTLRQLWSENAA